MSFEKKIFARCLKYNNHKLYISTKLMKFIIREKLSRFDFFLTVRRMRPKSPKRLTSLWANLSGMQFDYRIKTTATCQSQGINLQNRMVFFFFIFLLVASQFFCQFWWSKTYRYVLRRRPLREINFTKRKSLARLFGSMPWEFLRQTFKAICQILVPYKLL